MDLMKNVGEIQMGRKMERAIEREREKLRGREREEEEILQLI